MSKYSVDFVKSTLIEMGIEPLFDNYEDVEQKLKVRCPKHGIFYKTFNNFLESKKRKTNGCAKCAIDNQRKGLDYALSLVEQLGFIPLFLEYKNCYQKLLIRCPKHGDFKTDLRNLERMRDGKVTNICKKCRDEAIFEKVISDIKTLGLIHCFTEYKNNRQHLLVECPKHGKFFITYSNVQILIKRNGNGNGCRKCSNERKTTLTPDEKLSQRKYPEYYNWRKNVYQRDNYICQRCGCKSSRQNPLNAHHIQNYSNNKDLRISVDNGITFCKHCHREFHNKYGYKNNNREQIIEFIGEENNKWHNI